MSSSSSSSTNLFHSDPSSALDLAALYAAPTPQQRQLHRQHSAFLAQAGLEPIVHEAAAAATAARNRQVRHLLLVDLDVVVIVVVAAAAAIIVVLVVLCFISRSHLRIFNAQLGQKSSSTLPPAPFEH